MSWPTWDDWATVDAHCPRCAWRGKVTEAAMATLHEPGSEVRCPLCGASVLVRVGTAEEEVKPDVVV